MPVFWCNGEWIEGGNFALSPVDRGVILGLALFETLLAIDGRPKFVAAHARRWEESCARLGWAFPKIDLEAIATELLQRNGLAQGRARVRMTMTAGAGPLSDLARTEDALVWIAATPADDPPESLEVLVSPWKRNAESALAGLKSASYAENLVALDHARKAGFGETLFFNTDGRLCEAATSNVFLVSGKRVLTPALDCGCLPGVMRSVVIDLVKKRGLACEGVPLEQADLENADEVFLTSAVRGPVPVSRLGQRRFPATPVSASIRGWWKEEICRA